jgi:hypothetical protein
MLSGMDTLSAPRSDQRDPCRGDRGDQVIQRVAELASADFGLAGSMQLLHRLRPEPGQGFQNLSVGISGLGRHSVLLIPRPAHRQRGGPARVQAKCGRLECLSNVPGEYRNYDTNTGKTR